MRTVITEERFDSVGEVGCLFSVNVDDQGRAVSVAVVDDKREFVESTCVLDQWRIDPASDSVSYGTQRKSSVPPLPDRRSCASMLSPKDEAAHSPL
jgi:hypothetical protein